MAKAVGLGFYSIIFASLATSLKPTGRAKTLLALTETYRARAAAHALRQLRDALAVAPGEAAMLRAAGAALRALHPGLDGWAVGVFAEGCGCRQMSALDAGGAFKLSKFQFCAVFFMFFSHRRCGPRRPRDARLRAPLHGGRGHALVCGCRVHARVRLKRAGVTKNSAHLSR